MTTDIINDNIILQFSCFYPLFIMIINSIAIIYYKLIDNKKLFKLSVFLLFGVFLCEYLNIILKNKLFIPLGEKYGTSIENQRYLGILGRIGRPDGACNCGVFRNGHINKSISSGMPSGHSQLAWFIYGFLINLLFDINHKYKNIFLALGGLFSAFLSYSRVLVNCHTIEQITLGSFIGFVLGFSWFRIYKLYR
jgi:membrane-associated phospholipid phosphatase